MPDEVEAVSIPLDEESLPELHTLAPGEQKLRIETVEIGLSKKGNRMATIMMSIPNEPDAQSIWHYLVLPDGRSDARTNNQRARAIRSFAKAFGMPCTDTLEFERVVLPNAAGKEGYALLELRPADGQYEASNQVGEWIIPRG